VNTPDGKNAGLTHTRTVVLISADTEWRVVKELLPGEQLQASPYGEWFSHRVEEEYCSEEIVFLHGGWGKISAAASTQYAIDVWQPNLLINLGTCGGFEGKIERNSVILVEKTLVYDIYEQMGDPDEHIAHYACELDLTWLKQPYPQAVRKTLLVSADKDLDEKDIPMLAERFGAVAGDWESGAIAFVAQRNRVKCLILRGVSDLVGQSGGEAYDAFEVFAEGAKRVLAPLLEALPQWIACAQR